MSGYTFDTKTLKRIVTNMARIKIARSTSAPDAIRFRPCAYGMRIYRTNGTERFDAAIPMADMGGLPFALDTKSLRAAIKLAGDSITLERDENGQIMARIDGASVAVATHDAETFNYPDMAPDRNSLEDARRSCAFQSAADLRETLEWVSRASSSDETRYNLCSVLWDAARENPGDADKATLPDNAPRFVATDGHRLHTDSIMGEWCCGDLPESHIIPLPAVQAMCGAIGKGKSAASTRVDWVASTESRGLHHIAWRSGELDWTVSYRELEAEAEFPNWRNVIPNATAHQIGADADALATAFKAHASARCVKIVSDQFHGARLTSGGGDKLESVSKCYADGATVTGVGFNPAYMGDALAGFGRKRITLKTAAPNENRGYLNPFRIDACGDRMAVVMPMRMG